MSGATLAKAIIPSKRTAAYFTGGQPAFERSLRRPLTFRKTLLELLDLLPISLKQRIRINDLLLLRMQLHQQKHHQPYASYTLTLTRG